MGSLWLAAVCMGASPTWVDPRVSMEGTFFASDSVLVVPGLFGRALLDGKWVAEGSLSGVFGSDPSLARPANATLWFGVFREHRSLGAFEATAGLATPWITGGSAEGRNLLVEADRLSGSTAWWRYGRGRPAVLLRGRHGLMPADGRVGLSTEVVFGVGWDTELSEARVGASGVLRAAARPAPGLEVGLAFAAVLLAGDGVLGQLSVQPDARLHLFELWPARSPSGGPFVQAALRINLDPPAGPSFSGGVYGLTVGMGWRFAPAHRSSARG